MLFDYQIFIMLFNINNGSNDDVHQFIISEETTLTVYNDGTERRSNPHNICIAFTVEDVRIFFKLTVNNSSNMLSFLL